MIRLTCTQCKTVLEMDDAFAGGVCRCQHCGTIQTVPAHLKVTAGATKPEPAGKGLYAGRSSPPVPEEGSGLDQLADVVASSGLTRSALRKGHGASRISVDESIATSTYVSRAKKPSRLPLLLILSAVVLAAGAVVAFVVTRSGTLTPATNAPSPSAGTGAQTADSTPHQDSAPAAPAGPHFIKMPISAQKVVYVVDRSDAGREFFDPLKAAIYGSIRSLGADSQFAVFFWGRPSQSGISEFSYPDHQLATATPAHVEACQQKFADVIASGSTDVTVAIKKAAALKPDLIILVTAKGYNLSESLVDQVVKPCRSAHIKINVVDLADGDGQSVLQPITQQTDGAYFKATPADLK